MILNFKMKNVFSYKEEAELSMLAPSNQVKKRYEDNYNNVLGYDILKTAIIVGENAGGKSNFIKGIKYFIDMFNSNQKITSSLDTIFKIKSIDKNKIDVNETRQSFDIIIASEENKKIYKYSLIININGIEKEELDVKEDKKLKFKNIFRVSFINNLVKNSNIEINSISNKESLKIVNSINTNNRVGLWINSLATLSFDSCIDFINEIRKINICDNNYKKISNVYSYTNEELFLKNNIDILKTKEYFEIFKNVDSSISSIIIDEENPYSDSIVVRKIDDTICKRQITFDSSGVKQFMLFSLVLYKVIYENKMFFVDEMDSMLNPVLTANVINYIHGMETKGQFVITTHNIFNLTFRILMKEQMYLTAKKKSTLESRIYSIKEFNDIRYDANSKIYEYYMMGVLGAVGGENEWL